MMDGGGSSSSGPQTGQSFDHDECALVQKMDSQLVGVSTVVAGDAAVPVEAGEQLKVAGSALQLNKATVGVVSQVVEKKKRGRPPRGQGTAAAPKPPPPKRNKEEEEDVCFICFDGGSLVLCDRRGCPKAYHPACIKRDEAFFRSKAKWNCGWHICSVCQKAAHYMCYTCTYSLCKGCSKDAEYVCVRGNKGFCTTCMKTIMLIENKDLGNSELVQVDFDDKTSWEYLFKVYWLYLKGNLSLTMNELIHAKNPWRELVTKDYKQQACGRNNFANGGMVSISNNSSEHLESKVPKEQHEQLNHESSNSEKIKSNEVPNLDGSKEWASKELLELVAHVRNGDTSMLSQFDVQALLLDYIKRNNLRDPRRKSQIICDIRLKNLFGKPRVGHIEMLKLLEYHFLIKEDDQMDAFIPAGIVGSAVGNVGVDQNNSLMGEQGRKRRTRKKGVEKTPQTNPDEYAAIDLHNINLIYLRRNLLENLLGDEDKFVDKVVGSVVRIRVSCNDQKQDIYRLVQVVGTSKAAVAYKLGDKTTHCMLEVLNLNKKESTSIDAISNQEFSQEECRRLRQSIRCGLVKHWTVGEIQTKAFALQEVKLNDVLEAETLRLNHLRDRANEKGHKKDLREFIEKLQLLKRPEERQRRLTEIPKVHADPKMDPNYESEEDIAGIGEFLRSKYTSFNKNESRSSSPKSIAKEDGTNRSQPSREKRHARGASGRAKNECQVSVCGLESGLGNQQVVMSGSETSTATLPTGSSPPDFTSELDRNWHYRDPSGRIQGPFAIVQLRKWSTTGYFPVNMRIWTSNELDDSVLLTDALNGFSHKDNHTLHNVPRQQETGLASDSSTLHSFNSNQTFVAAPLHQDSELQSEELKSVLGHKNQGSHGSPTDRATDLQCYEKPSSSESYAGQSSGQNCRSVPLDLDLNYSTSLVSVTTPSESTERHADTDILDLPSPTPKTSKVNMECQAVEKQESGLVGNVQSSQKLDLPSPSAKPRDEDFLGPAPVPMDKDLPSSTDPPKDVVTPSSSVPTGGDQREHVDKTQQSQLSKVSISDVGPDWNSASGLDIGETQLHELANQWPGYSPTAPKPSVNEWDINLVSMSSLKQQEVLGDHVTPDSIANTNQLVHSSPCQPASNIASWQAIVNEPIEFSTLVEESMSDLLAEVDAMESQSGLASPTSAMKCSDEMDCRNDCFSSIEELSPNADAGKSDAVSSNTETEAQFPPSVTDDPGGVAQADGSDRFRASGGHSATSSEGETKPADAPREAGLDVHPPQASAMSQGVVGPSLGRNRGLEPIDAGWPGMPGNMNMGWTGSPQGYPNVGWGNGLVPPWGNPGYNLGAYNGNVPWDSHSPRRYNGERFAGQRDWGYQGGDSGFGRGRPMWSRQSHGGGGGGSGGGGYSRPPPKGQRVCKFYESGRCKKGASCDYLHP